MKILLVQTSFIGDTILSTPVLSALKKKYPHTKISIMTTPAGAVLFNNDPRVDEIIQFEKRGREKGISGLFQKAEEIKVKKFERVYSLHRSYRTALMLAMARIPRRIGFADSRLSFLYTHKRSRPVSTHAVLRNLSIFEEADIPPETECPLTLYPPEPDRITPETRQRLGDLSTPYAVLAPGSAWYTKQWNINGYLETARFLLKTGLKVVLIGGKADIDVCTRISSVLDVTDMSGRIALWETMYLIQYSALLVCNDSMALHMGSAFTTPTVAIFCATSPSFGFGPWQNPNAVIVEDQTLSCKPCRPHGGTSCPARTDACMNVSAQRVIQAARSLLK